jgi:gliding motility-associated-like protein
MLPDMVQVCDAAEGAMLMVSNNKSYQTLSYMWMPEDKFPADQLTGSTATMKPGEDGIVSVMLENQFGCMGELSSTVELNDVGSARIVASDTVIKVGNPVDISVLDCIDCQYEWTSSPEIDDYNPNASTITTTPLEPTEYTVKVIKGDCERILTITIVTEGVLCSEENIFVPRAFTPNGDGQNDVLYVRSNVIDEMHFIIYSRWGQEVFDTRNIEEGWDGTFRGNVLPPDVYGYIVRAICIDGSEITLQGNVTLLR